LSKLTRYIWQPLAEETNSDAFRRMEESLSRLPSVDLNLTLSPYLYISNFVGG